MQKYFKLLVLLMCGAGVLYGAEPRFDNVVARSLAKKIQRKRSPLTSEMTRSPEPYDILEDIDMSSAGQELISSTPFLNEPCVNNVIRLKNKISGYEMVLQRGAIAKCGATVVINPYNPDIATSKVSAELYNGAGTMFTEVLGNFMHANQAIFAQLKNKVGSACVLPVDGIGNLPIRMMVLMYLPQAFVPESQFFMRDKNDPTLKSVLQRNALKQSKPTMPSLRGGLMAMLDNLWVILRTNGVEQASIVLPAMGDDPVFKDYPGSKMAIMMVATVSRFLSKLYVEQYDADRLQNISFVVDNEEAYAHYSAALKRLYTYEKDRLELVEQQNAVNN